jgi:alpha-beta hydrolase superfamily lysophospholipase
MIEFNYQTLSLRDDYEGRVIATLISAKQNTGSRKALLHLHGFIDYFFHPHLAEAFLREGYDFYALELRKYAHSLLPHQHPNYCRRIEEYFEELSLAIEKIYTETTQKVILLGHSTGGLLAALYANTGEKRDLVDTLILNSPFLEFYIRPKIKRCMGKLLAKPIATLMPFANIPDAVSPVYPTSLHKDYEGEWDFDLTWKSIQGYPAYYAWIHAIDKAQRTLQKVSDIQTPVLLLHSSRSFIPKQYTPEAQTADIVLDVDDMKRIGPKLGTNVTLIETPNAKHDVFLSQKEIREKALKEMFEWLKKT